MTDLQRHLLTVITTLAAIDDFDKFGQDSAIRYGFLNYVAKYGLAKNSYAITAAARSHLEANGLLTANGLRRGKKNKKNRFTYEHPIPSNVIADEIIANRDDASKISEILKISDVVTILTTEENDLLSGRLRSDMPAGWSFQDDPYARYVAVGLPEQSKLERVSVFGALAR